ncbi:ROK family protein [Frankia sp. AgB1.9]|uniref:ROK family protein n=1 Tax=unclassified Frankia TaxID=2632575 RepID=UPI001932E6C0|nr:MULTISPECIES: ROK family protein [unclassified Frankia]MBL7549582.1 ROK family protein [Frankia sp. AgB1.9]MBL7620438.1 ROK family protein [Frankia sp. AgB1.8]
MALPAHAESRRRNLAAVLRLLHERGPLRQVEISDTVAVSRGTGISLIEELLDLGLLVDATPTARGTRGRPSPLIVASEDVVAVAAEIAADTARVDLVTLGGSIQVAESLPIAPSALGPEKTLRRVVSAVSDLLAARPALRVAGVAVAVHGAVDSQRRIVFAPNLGWEGADLAPIDALLRDALPRQAIRPVVVGNDADLGALGEQRRGAGRDYADFLYLSAERGIGGGLVAGGAVVLGSNGLAGEVGHLKVAGATSPCGCGQRGCWETEIGTAALSRKAPATSSDVLLARAQSGDHWAVDVVEDVATWLGYGLGLLIPVLQPGAVVLGGHLARIAALAPSAVDRAIHETCPPRLAMGVTIVPSRLGTDSALIGAAELALGPLLDDPGSLWGQPPRGR